MLNLEWMKCGSGRGHWCSLTKLDLSSITDESGVYVIWHGGKNPATVRVGQGNFKERFSAHRNDPEILKYQESGPLYVTWAELSEGGRKEVEYNLFARLRPLNGTVSWAPSTTVNLPW